MAQRRLFWSVVEGIEERIAAGQYVAGSRLPPERVLAEEFNVSRPTIREAVIALEVRGRVEVKTSSGVYVLSKADSDRFLNVSPFELTQARALIEGEAAALAAANISEDQLNQLKDAMQDMRNSKSELANAADEKFHRIISEATCNAAISLAVENFWELRETLPQVRDAYKDVCMGNEAQRYAEHQAILDALEERHPEKARSAMHAHFNRLINALFEASERQALEEVKMKSSQTRGLYSLNHLVTTQ